MSDSRPSIRRIFTGNFPVGVDKQRRMTLPRSWRLPTDTENTQFYIMPGRGNKLQIVTEERMGSLFDALEATPLANGENLDSFTDIASHIQVVTLDQQGRFALNPDLAAYAGITDKARFLGSFTCGTLIRDTGEKDGGKAIAELAAAAGQADGAPKESSYDRLQNLETAARNARQQP